MKTKLAYSSFGVATILVFTGLIIPPQGVVDGSVLIAMGQFLIMCATLAGVGQYVDIIRRFSNTKK